MLHWLVVQIVHPLAVLVAVGSYLFVPPCTLFVGVTVLSVALPVGGPRLHPLVFLVLMGRCDFVGF